MRKNIKINKIAVSDTFPSDMYQTDSRLANNFPCDRQLFLWWENHAHNIVFLL